jgi:Universal stress protein family
VNNPTMTIHDSEATRDGEILTFPDGSSRAWRAFTVAVHLAEARSTRLAVAVPPSKLPFAPATVGEVDDARRDDAKTAGQIIAHAIELAEMHRVRVHVVPLTGRSARATINVIQNEQPYAVVLPRDRRLWGILSLNRRSKRIRAKVACNVLVVD